MEVRNLQKKELLPALHLVWEVFAEEVAPLYPPEGVAEFQKFIKYDNIISMYQKQEIEFFGAFEGDELCGTIAVKSIGHICLFFVKKQWQKKGAGRMLYEAACDYCARKICVSRMTVNAAPGAVVVYQHLGMRQTGPMQQVNGISYIPMETYINVVTPKKSQDKKRTGLIIAGIVAGVLFIVLLMVGGVFLIRSIYNESKNIVEDEIENRIEEWDDEDPMDPDSPLWDNRGDGDSEDSSDNQAGGSAAIPADIAPNLKYEIKEDSYTFTDDEKQSTVIGFDVKYPKLEGLDKKVQDKINKEIKNCAMETVDEIYEHPSEEFKEKILGTQNPMLVSQVTYKVCYASNDFISILFEDAGTKGSQDDYYQHLRTLNIGLQDGKVYEVKDIVDLDDEFIDEWLDVMREEAGNDQFLSELSKTEIKETLSGKSIDGNYVVNFFFDEDGVEIGYDLNYASGDSNDHGYVWVTAPFTYDEIEYYEKNDDFWAFFD
ncbi:MAG: GNAT family N-acetyltransferase [Lachnospiraceae bacterium]